MSTNIRIDVTLQKLQEIARETQDLNRRQVREITQDNNVRVVLGSAATSSGSNMVDPFGITLSEALNSDIPVLQTYRIERTTGRPTKTTFGYLMLDTSSSVPNTYKPLDLGAGAFLPFRPVHGWLLSTSSGQRIIYSADGSQSIEWAARSAFSPSDFLLPEWPPPDPGPGEISQGIQTYNSAGTEGRVVLPLGRQSFIYAEFIRRRTRGVRYNQVQDIRPIDDIWSEPVVESRDETNLVAKCFLVGLNRVKEITMPSRLLAEMDRIWPMPITSVRQLPLSVGVSGYIYIDWSLDFDRIDNTVGNQVASPLFGHYLDWGNRTFTVGTPAIYWYLRNYSDTQSNWLDPQLTPEVIRGLYQAATYGSSRGNSWYAPLPVLERDTSGALLGYRIEWYRQDTYNDLSEDKTARVSNYGPFGRARFNSFSGSAIPIPLYAWDVNVPSYCTAQLLALGFTESDLTF